MKLIVIDMQKALLVEELFALDKLTKNIAKLIERARKKRVEVIFFQHDAGEGSGFSKGDDGFELAEGFAPQEGEKSYIKTINSCFGNRDFSEYLESVGETELMIVGLQTEYCIDATIKSAFEKGYRVIVPAGCNSTFDNDFLKARKAYRYYNEWIWPGSFAECVPMSEALKLLKN